MLVFYPLLNLTEKFHMDKFQVCFTKIHVDSRDKTYSYSCTGISDSKLSVGKNNQALQ